MPAVSEDGLLELLVDRPVAGGRMLARHDGKVVFVAGAIPGERVRVRIERVQRQASWATAVEILDPSPDRREVPFDPVCGGLSYAHIRYERQQQLKSEIVADAFRRLGKLTLDEPPHVAPSPETGYRLRARLHIRGRRAGLFREGTHDLCDAAPARQLLAETTSAVDRMLGPLDSRLAECDAVVIGENVRAAERVLHLEPRDGARLDDLAGRVPLVDGVTGLTTTFGGRHVTLAGSPTVTDTAADLFHGDAPISDQTAWTRRASSFFQGNRHLTGALVRCVLDVTPGERIVDLYAGVGLFSVALAARGSEVAAVEGDRSAGADLAVNAGPWRDRLHVMHAPVERAVHQRPDPVPDAVILDPPRTGVSADAVHGLIRWNAARLVYVSCDPPTLARDAARFTAAGYQLISVDAFDLFPNTPHVETVAVFEK